MKSQAISRPAALVVILLLLALIFVLDVVTPVGFGHWIFYLVPIYATARWLPRRNIYYVAFASTALILVGYLISSSGLNPWWTFYNRALQLAVLWLVTLLVVRSAKLNEQLTARAADLEQELAARTQAEATLRVSEERLRNALQSANDGLQRLRDSEERFRLVVENSPSPIGLLDETGTLKYVSPAFTAAFGIPQADVLQRSALVQAAVAQADPAQVTPEYLVERGLASLNHAISWLNILQTARYCAQHPGERVATELPMPDANGVMHDLQYLYQGYQSSSSECEVVSFIHDVTEHRTLERMLKEMNAETQARLRFQSMLLAAIGQAVIVTDLDGRIVYWNDAAITMYGWLYEEAMGRSLQELTGLEMLLEQANAIMAAPQAGQERVGEFQVSRRDGSTFWALVLNTPLFDAEGKFSGIIGISTDISTRRQAEETAHLAVREMERALRLRDEFTAAMSHELRTPLNGILATAETLTLQIHGSLNERQLRSVSAIETSGRHLLALINDVLDLSKIEANRLELDLEWLDVDEICQASLMFAKEIAIQKRIQLTYRNSQPDCSVYADARRLKQMLVNLLSNAVKFTPEDGAVQLRVNVEPERQVIQFLVQDTGIGIAAEDMSKLFQPFTQLGFNRAKHAQGTGLGLALVKSLTVQHGGIVKAESSGVAGEGSRFTIELPYIPEPPPEITPDEPEPFVASWGATPMPGRTVLLAEDNEISSEVISSYLEFLGYQVLAAGTGVEALEMALAHHPDLILMDIHLPLMDGLEVVRRLRQDPAFTATPIIAITALAMLGDRERCIQSGATDYMSKPLQMQALSELMTQLLAKVVAGDLIAAANRLDAHQAAPESAPPALQP